MPIYNSMVFFEADFTSLSRAFRRVAKGSGLRFFTALGRKGPVRCLIGMP